MTKFEISIRVDSDTEITIRYIPPQTRRPTCDKIPKGKIFGHFGVFRSF
jgi:hypothetical protein